MAHDQEEVAESVATTSGHTPASCRPARIRSTGSPHVLTKPNQGGGLLTVAFWWFCDKPFA